MQSLAPSLQRFRFLALALLLVIFLAGLGGASFQRKVESFQPLGFDFEPRQGGFLVGDVHAGEVGLLAQDEILMVRGEQVPSSLKLREWLLAEESAELLVLRGAALVEVLYQRPGLSIDFAYLILALIAVTYLLVGLFTIFKDGHWEARLFFLWCLAAAALYILSPQLPPRDGADRLILVVDQLARTLLPALTLHLFLVFPAPLLRLKKAAQRLLILAVYLPSVVLLGYHAEQILGAKLFGRSDLVMLWVDRMELLLLVGFSLISAVTLVMRLASSPPWEEKRQLQWITAGLVGGYLPFFALYVVPWIFRLDWPAWTPIAGVLPLFLVPLGFAYAILKYKLLDIGLILRDTISYSLTVMLGIFGFSLIHAMIQRGLGEDLVLARSFLTFGAGIAIAGVLVPTRGAIAAGLERFQHRHTLEQREALSVLGAELLQERDLARLTTTLIDRLGEVLFARVNLYLVESPGVLAPVDQDAGLPAVLTPNALGEIWDQEVYNLSAIRLPGDEANDEAQLVAAGFRYAFPLRVRGHRIGLFLASYKFDHEPLDSEDINLARGFLNQASLALENAHLLSELRLRLHEVEKLEEHNRGIVESSPAGIAILKPRSQGGGGVHDYEVLEANPAFAELAGRPLDELAGRMLVELVPVEKLPSAEECPYEISYCELSGRERSLQLSVAPYSGAAPDSDGALILIVQDTSERSEMEAQLRERERLASLGMLAAGVAHEVNTPLTGISSYAQFLLADINEEHPHHEILKKLERQTFRAAQIVQNLLELSRNQGELTPVRLGAVLDEAVQTAQERADNSQVSVIWEPRDQAAQVQVLGDAGELGQIFNNLIANAIDAMAPRGGGEVRLTLERRGERLLARVSDTGPGIPVERQERIFQPFFSGKLGQGGTGLGLAITSNLVRRHRGRISISNHTDGPGCTFTVDLPEHLV